MSERDPPARRHVGCWKIIALRFVPEEVQLFQPHPRRSHYRLIVKIEKSLMQWIFLPCSPWLRVGPLLVVPTMMAWSVFFRLLSPWAHGIAVEYKLWKWCVLGSVWYAFSSLSFWLPCFEMGAMQHRTTYHGRPRPRHPRTVVACLCSTPVPPSIVYIHTQRQQLLSPAFPCPVLCRRMPSVNLRPNTTTLDEPRQAKACSAAPPLLQTR